MALLTLLDVVNSTLDQMDGFRVSSIDDGIESQQIASIAEKVFNDITSDVFSTTRGTEILQLEGLADSTKPNYLKLPAKVIAIQDNKVRYNTSIISGVDYKEIIFFPPDNFLNYVNSRNEGANGIVEVTDYSGVKMLIGNNNHPSYFTTFNDTILVFDSYKADVENTLQGSKSSIVANTQKVFTQADTYIIDLPEYFHPTYLNAVIAETSAALREEPIFHAARAARSGIIKAKRRQRIGINNRRTNRYGR